MAMTTAPGSSLSEQMRAARDEMKAMRGEVSEIAGELQRLMVMEKELALAEIQEAKSHAVKGTTFGLVAGLLGIITSVFLFLAIMFGLATEFELWAAALITTGIAAVVLVIFGFLAKREFSAFSPVPQRAIKTIQEDMKWARSQIKSSVT